MPNSNKTKVTLIYDLISPFSHIAYALLKRYEAPWTLEIVLKPVSLGYVFQAASNRAPLVVPNKGQMMAQEFRMFCEYFDVKVSDKAWTFHESNRNKPPNSVSLMRFMLVLSEEKPQLLDTATARLFDAIFGEGDLSMMTQELDPDKILSILGPDNLHTETLKEMINKSSSKEIKDRIKSDAKSVVDDIKVYGVPFMVFEKPDGSKKSFMGSDRFEYIASWLEKPYQAGKPNGGGNQRSKL